MDNFYLYIEEHEHLIKKYSTKILALERIFERIEKLYPEHKIFAFSSLMDDTRESLAKIAKECGLFGYQEVLKDFGYEIISPEQARVLRPNVIYMPGDEPDCIKNKVQNALKLLAEYYPDKVIEGSIEKAHKSLAGKISGLCQWLGYQSFSDFLEAYGYEYIIQEQVKVADYAPEIIAQLKQMYCGKYAKSIKQIHDENPAIRNKLEVIETTSKKLFGMTFAEYLVSIGVLVDYDKRAMLALEEVVMMLKTLYPTGVYSKTLRPLYEKHPEIEPLCKLADTACKKNLGKTLIQYLFELGILKDKDAEFATKFTHFQFNKAKNHIEKYLGSDSRVVIPAQVNTIDKGAFANSDVVEIVLEPDSELKNIDDGAFENCLSLVLIDLSNAKQTELKIGENAFKNCQKLEEIRGEWTSIRTKKGAFEGCSNVFVRDGDYIYPQLWLYNWLNNSSASGAFNLDGENVNGIYLPYVLLLNRYTKRQYEDFYYVAQTNIPVAADAGYGNVVYFAGMEKMRETRLNEIGMNKTTANTKVSAWTVFYMPTEESVAHFLKNIEIKVEQTGQFVTDQTVYTQKQRELFVKFNEYYADERAKVSSTIKMDPIDFTFDPITTEKRKIVSVSFIGHAGYDYRCKFDAQIGDIVYVEGSRAGDLGVVCSVDSNKSSVSSAWDDEDDYYKDVTVAYRQPNRGIKPTESYEYNFYVDFLFKGACTEAKMSEIFPDVPILDVIKRGSSSSDSNEWMQFVLDAEKEKIDYFSSITDYVEVEYDESIWGPLHDDEDDDYNDDDYDDDDYDDDADLVDEDDEEVVDWKNLTTYDGKCSVFVKFESRGYNYNYDGKISIGDKVYVGGKLSGQVGIVEKIAEWNKSPYMQTVTEVIRDSTTISSQATSQDRPNDKPSLSKGVNSATRLVVPNTVERIPKIKSKSTFETIKTNGASAIGYEAFCDCKKLTQVQLDVGLTEIESYAFIRCTELQSVIMPDTVRLLGYGAFYGCTKLSKVYLSEELKEIEWKTFYNCNSLTTIVIPANVQKIWYDAFTGCSKLESIIFLNSDCTFDTGNPFEGAHPTIIAPPGGTVEAYAQNNNLDFVALSLDELKIKRGSVGTSEKQKKNTSRVNNKYVEAEDAIYAFFGTKK